MRSSIRTLLVAGTLAAGTTAAMAGDIGFSIGFSQPGLYGRVDFGNPYPYSYALPAPVYVRPAPIYYAPPRHVWAPPVYRGHWRDGDHRRWDRGHRDGRHDGHRHGR